MNDQPEIIVVMGVSGCGKSTIGAELAAVLNCVFIEGDDFHTPDALEKMKAGTPLNDEDRWPWLAKIASAIKTAHAPHGRVIVACSALKKAYRDFLGAQTGSAIRFVHLELTRNEAARRMAQRSGHFMPASLIESQFATLEPPRPDEAFITLDANQPPERIVQMIRQSLSS